MASYFDRTKAESYLPAAIRERDDFAALAAECEADLINRYTQRARSGAHTAHGTGAQWYDPDGLENLSTATTRTVYLRHYEADADDVDATDLDERAFLDAFGLELARLIRWRANARSEDGVDGRMVASEGRGRRSVTYTRHARSDYPPGFGSFLRPFDLRERAYVV